VIETTSICLSGLAAELPRGRTPLAELRVHSPVETLAGFGFDSAAIAENLDELILTATREAMTEAGVESLEIGALLYVSAMSHGHVRASSQPTGGVLDEFCYQASWLQDVLTLDSATISGVAEQGCAGVFSAIRQARALLVAEPELNHVLCVGADRFGPDAEREILYNVVSDAACAVVVSRNRGWARWLAFAQISKGYYWDVPARGPELIAAYFPGARTTIARALAQAKLSPEQIDLVIPTGVNRSTWPILLGLCGIPESRLHTPQTRFGHTVAADSFYYLREARAQGLLRAGMRVLLFTYGFGSSWCALVVEITEEVAA
jgi:3-oxoacyl-[acyl-carrier-protein] synthase-3